MIQEAFPLTDDHEDSADELPAVGTIVSVKGRHGSWKVARIRRKAKGDKTFIAVVVREIIGCSKGEDECDISEHFIRPENIVLDRPRRRVRNV